MFFDLLSTFTWVGIIVKVKRVRSSGGPSDGFHKHGQKVLEVRKTFKMLPASSAFILNVLLSSKTTIYYLYGHEIMSTFTFLGLINLKRVKRSGPLLDH